MATLVAHEGPGGRPMLFVDDVIKGIAMYYMLTTGDTRYTPAQQNAMAIMDSILLAAENNPLNQWPTP